MDSFAYFPRIIKVIVASAGILVLSVVVLFFLSFVSPIVLVEDVTSRSRLVGQVLITEEPLVYLKNVPYFRNVSSHIRWSTPTVITRETPYLLDELRNNCGNCLDDERLTTPIRVEFVPPGTVFTVVKEFRLNWVNLFFDSYEFVVLRDDKGNFSEARKGMVEAGKINTINSGVTYMKNEPWLEEIIQHIQKTGSAKVEYCPLYWEVGDRNSPSTSDSLSNFIRAFELQQDVELWSNYTNRCENGGLVGVDNLDSFMTMYYYLPEWSMRGSMRLKD